MSLKRGIISTFFVQAPTLMMYFVSSMCMTRILGNEGRGAYALLQNQVSLLAMLFGLSLSLGITYFTTRNNGDPSQVVRVAATGF
ncbi:MAG: oligosaccharide flippase family protein, partial [Bacteroidetes bacterium]|nr:oligosaccharide flippase family protein [Bacteroidota bacterium]